MLISIICVFNDKNILEENLINSLEYQNEEYELILLDNRTNKFSSAAEALNFGANQAKGDLFIFSHQDIKFYKNNLKDIKRYCEGLKNLGIAGVQGVSEENNGRPISNIYSGIPPEKAFDMEFNEIKYTQTLDELLLIIPKEVFDKYQFDNKTCNHWHLYGADYCLNIKNHGFDVVILPITLYHRSKGESMSLEYFKTLKKLLKKYKNIYPRVYTTCLLSHNPKCPVKLNFLYFLEKIHFRMPLMNFLSSFNFLKRIFK